MKRFFLGLLTVGVLAAGASAADYWHISINRFKIIDPKTHISCLRGQSGFRGEQNEWAWFSFVEIPGGRVDSKIPAAERQMGGGSKIQYLGYVRGAAFREAGEILCDGKTCQHYPVKRIHWEESNAGEVRAYGYILANQHKQVGGRDFVCDALFIFISPSRYLNAQGDWVENMPYLVPAETREVPIRPYVIIYNRPFMEFVTSDAPRRDLYDTLFEFNANFTLDKSGELASDPEALTVVQKPHNLKESFIVQRTTTAVHPRWQRRFVRDPSKKQ